MTTSEPEIARQVLVGDTADIYLHRTLTILRSESINPDVAMEFVPTEDCVFAGIGEVVPLLSRVLPDTGREVWALPEGSSVEAGEVCLRIRAPYAAFGLYETAVAGTLANCSGWATAARACVEAAQGIPVVSFGARRVHPSVSGIMDYSAVVGGCVSCSSLQGSRLSGLTPWGGMPHAYVLLVGDTVRATMAFDRHMPPEVPRVALVDTFNDEAEEAIAVARSLRERLRAVLLDTPPERGGVTPDLVYEVRERLNQAGFRHVDIYVSGGLDPERITEFVETGSPVSLFVVGQFIAGASPIAITGDIKEIDRSAIAKRGRVPGITENPRLLRVL